MKKLFFSILLSFVAISSAFAVVDTVETPSSVKATITNATSPWFAVPTDNIGIGLTVSNGNCSVEIALQPFSVCDAGGATSFDWDPSPSVSSGNKKFVSINGASCVRAICSNNSSGILFIRRH